MKVCILQGSPRPRGNTASLVKSIIEELEHRGCVVKNEFLYQKDIRPCYGCRCCQRDHTIFGCVHNDDLVPLFDDLLECDLIVLATPIYSWYCTPPLKATLDRLVYGMNKYYGETKGPSLWAGTKVALVATCGYPPEKGADLWEEGMKRYCKHSQLEYIGILTGRHLGYDRPFMDLEKEERARLFAATIFEKVSASLS
ncbi:MAG: flavodoxin family protein [Fastidiosipilaceae bacterium]|nr:flavodoxin family protein [Clostridiaceae bacterium]